MTAADEPDELTDPPRRPPAPSRTQTTRLSGRDIRMLAENAELLSTDETEAVRRAIRHSNWLLTLSDKGRTLLVRDEQTGVTREVILLP